MRVKGELLHAAYFGLWRGFIRVLLQFGFQQGLREPNARQRSDTPYTKRRFVPRKGVGLGENRHR